MSQKRLRHWHLLKMVLERRMTLGETAKVMDVSYWHAKRQKVVMSRDWPRGHLYDNWERGEPMPFIRRSGKGSKGIPR